ncbi:hypothetical protein CKO25_11220 [Thiocapsa imhoffii]|uniref:Histidine kinase/HSP90-like ATPase domain-containing protein n=1 Tax=Thiocapsa imhoffii TaxID=382777 RepID=A0A9X0WII5_9GAMM|nr:ATP-binding protein [Thiocapsa imhoffii]MBK1645203.1 hypothetical protein [Thiocapsa imhoffii]
MKSELRIDRLLLDLDPLIKGTLKGAERVRDLVQDRRCFSSGQQGDSTRFDLVHLIATALHWMTKGAQRELVTTLDLPDELMVEGHPGHIHQVLMNLVQNALDAMQTTPEPPRLSVKAGRNGGVAWLTIRDNGPGIAKAATPERLRRNAVADQILVPPTIRPAKLQGGTIRTDGEEVKRRVGGGR